MVQSEPIGCSFQYRYADTHVTVAGRLSWNLAIPAA